MIICRGEAIMLVKLSIILSIILTIILKIILDQMLMAFHTANNILLIK